MTVLQLAALLMQGGLALFARRFPRLRAYLAIALGLNLAKLALQQLPVIKPYVGIDLAVILLEGLLFVAGPVGLAWALQAHWKAVAGFVWTCWEYAVLVWPRISGSTLLSFYMAVQLVSHAFIVGHALWRASGAKVQDAQDKLLLMLAAIGLSGGIFALVWGDDWSLVSCGNVLTYALVTYFSFKGEHVAKSPKA